MNKLIVYSLFLLALSSCAKNSSSEGDAIHTGSLRELFTLKSGQVISGRAISKVTHTNSNLLLLGNERSLNQQSQLTTALVLNNELPLDPLVIEEGNKLEIGLLLNGKIILVADQSQSVVHVLATRDATGDVQQVLEKLKASNYKIGKINFGYGLSFMRGKWSLSSVKQSGYRNPFNILMASDLTRKQGTGVVANSLIDDDGNSNLCALGSCTSGGAGSTSCSISETTGGECTVTCSSGYYACCNSPTVRCYCCKISQ